jgi:myo-inositol-1(or 4)-monophosphatase
MESEELERWLNAAMKAAQEGGEVLKAFRGKFEVRSKQRFDLVTTADLECQRTIRAYLENEFPDHVFIMEEDESKRSGGGSRPAWIIDPIDGTTNYVHDLPGYCISIGLLAEGELLVGVVHDPAREEMFRAARGQGAWLGTERLRTTSIRDLEKAIVATEAPYAVMAREQTMASWRRFTLATQGVRQLGGTALDLAYVAAGRLDGFWSAEENHPWDVAAGAVLVREAGGIVTDFNSTTFDPFTPDIVASNGPLHPEMIRLVREE